MPAHFPEGTYLGRVTSAGWTKAKTGRDMLVIQVVPEYHLTITYDSSGEPQDETEPTGSTWTRHINCVVVEDNPKALDYMIRKLRFGAGWSGEDMGRLPDDLEDGWVRCVCKHDDDREQWDLMLPPLSSSPVKNEPGVGRKMNAIFGRRVKESLSDTGPPPAKTEAVEPQDDDLPF